jgi:hypothetical protein
MKPKPLEVLKNFTVPIVMIWVFLRKVPDQTLRLDRAKTHKFGEDTLEDAGSRGLGAAT